MKLLWITNVPLNEASILMKSSPTYLGGWLQNSSEFLSKSNNVELYVAFPEETISNGFSKINGNSITYYPFEKGNNNKLDNHSIFIDILKNIKPDLVHIHGTELPHSLAAINACEELSIKHVISIQGLVSVIAKHMYANLPIKTIFGYTLRNLLKKDNVSSLRTKFRKRGKFEIEAIKKSRHVIGRTTWDKTCTEIINSKVNYYHCNETLREEFYKHHWNLEKCERYTIFVSQGEYPIKGLHYMLEAMEYILHNFPNAKLYISGKDITKSLTIKDRLIRTYYGKYIKKLIVNKKLSRNVFFTGPLNERQMCQRYLKSNVFVCPSSIENSPNSLGEAMLLGVPCVASYVGGIPDLLTHDKEGCLYQHDAPYMLAHYVSEIFRDEEKQKRLSSNARKRAFETHNIDKNNNELINIYNRILNS